MSVVLHFCIFLLLGAVQHAQVSDHWRTVQTAGDWTILRLVPQAELPVFRSGPSRLHTLKTIKEHQRTHTDKHTHTHIPKSKLCFVGPHPKEIWGLWHGASNGDTDNAQESFCTQQQVRLPSSMRHSWSGEGIVTYALYVSRKFLKGCLKVLKLFLHVLENLEHIFTIFKSV